MNNNEEKTMNGTIVKLDDQSLDNISGGFVQMLVESIIYAIVHTVKCGGMAIGGAIGATGCGIASGVKFHKGHTGSGIVLAATAATCAGVAALGIVKMKNG